MLDHGLTDGVKEKQVGIVGTLLEGPQWISDAWLIV